MGQTVCDSNMVEVVNRQRKRKIDTAQWQLFTEEALKVLPVSKVPDVTIAFVSDRAMSELNRMWRHKQGTTDVLSFPANDNEFEDPDSLNLGDVVISVEQAARQARNNKMTFEAEVSQLILHGLIHLCGYDHETDKGEMNRLELGLRKKLGILD